MDNEEVTLGAVEFIIHVPCRISCIAVPISKRNMESLDGGRTLFLTEPIITRGYIEFLHVLLPADVLFRTRYRIKQ